MHGENYNAENFAAAWKTIEAVIRTGNSMVSEKLSQLDDIKFYRSENPVKIDEEQKAFLSFHPYRTNLSGNLYKVPNEEIEEGEEVEEVEEGVENEEGVETTNEEESPSEEEDDDEEQKRAEGISTHIYTLFENFTKDLAVRRIFGMPELAAAKFLNLPPKISQENSSGFYLRDPLIHLGGKFYHAAHGEKYFQEKDEEIKSAIADAGALGLDVSALPFFGEGGNIITFKNKFGQDVMLYAVSDISLMNVISSKAPISPMQTAKENFMRIIENFVLR